MRTDAIDKAAMSEAARHIARTAAKLFAKRGYDATSVREIVEAAGVTKPTLYYHFGSKEGLAQALLHLPLTSLIASYVSIVAADEPPEAILANLFDANFEFCREEPDRARFYYAVCFGPLGANLAGELLKFVGGLKQPINDTIDRMALEGVVAPDRLDDFGWACHGLMTSAVMEFLYKGRDFEPGLARRLVGDLLRGFGEPGYRGRGA